MSPLPLYTFCTPTHRALRDEWLLPSVGDGFDVRNHEGAQLSETGAYKSDRWVSTMVRKVDTTLRAIDECWGGMFVFSDVDIQCFGLTPAYLLNAVRDCDLAFQQNDRYGRINTGFFVCRANNATKSFWTAVRALLLENKRGDDQDCAQFLLQRYDGIAMYRIVRAVMKRIVPWHAAIRTDARFHVRWRVLGREIYLPGAHWEPGEPLAIPSNILVHHANWTVGIEHKIAQLRYVKSLVDALPGR